MLTPHNKWVWYGTAGHFIAARYCRFHLCTKVGRWLISTVGDYHPRGGDDNGDPTPIGCERTFETYVFDLRGGTECECGCGMPKPARYSEIDSLGANSFVEAHVNHYALCEKWANLSKREPAPC